MGLKNILDGLFELFEDDSNLFNTEQLKYICPKIPSCKYDLSCCYNGDYANCKFYKEKLALDNPI